MTAPWRVLAVVAALVLVLACGKEEPADVPATTPTSGAAEEGIVEEGIASVPTPDLSGSDAAVRKQVGDLRAKLDEVLADPEATADERARAYADLGLVYVVYDFLDAADAAIGNARVLQPEEFQWIYLGGYLDKLQGRLDGAVLLLGRALEMEPDFLPAAIRLGQARLERGENEEAKALFERALELDPKAAAAYEGLGQMASSLGDAQAAVDYYEKALAADPEATSLHYALGQAYRNLGDREKARYHLERRGQNPPRIPDPVLNPLGNLGQSAQFYVMRGAELLEDQDFQGAAAAYRRALVEDAENLLAYRGLSYAVEHLGDLEGAILHLESAIERGKMEDPVEEKKERTEAHRVLGGLLVLAGRDEEAIERFEETLELSPGQGDVLMKLANALAREGRFREALERYDELLEAHPEEASAIYVKRATALVNLGRQREAVADFERAALADPEDPEVRLLYAEALEFLGRTEDAGVEWAEAARLSPDGPERARLLARDGHRLLDQGRLAEALAQFEASLEIDPEQPATRYQLASLLGHLGRYDDAVVQFRRVVEEQPRHAAARRGEILVLLLTGRHGEARVRLQEALKVFPQDARLALTQARLLASTPDVRVRDGRLALEIASRLLKVRDDLRVRETVAMALAEAGIYDEAVRMQKTVVAEAEKSGDLNLLAEVRRKLTAFERGEPWTAASGEEIVAVTLGAPG